MDSRAGGVKRSLPGGVRRGPRDSLVTACRRQSVPG